MHDLHHHQGHLKVKPVHKVRFHRLPNGNLQNRNLHPINGHRSREQIVLHPFLQNGPLPKAPQTRSPNLRRSPPSHLQGYLREPEHLIPPDLVFHNHNHLLVHLCTKGRDQETRVRQMLRDPLVRTRTDPLADSVQGHVLLHNNSSDPPLRLLPPLVLCHNHGDLRAHRQHHLTANQPRIHNQPQPHLSNQAKPPQSKTIPGETINLVPRLEMRWTGIQLLTPS